MVCKDTLRIKHLPKELSDAQKEDFIKHFGAFKTKVITSKVKSKSVVYAKFENEEIAKNIMFRLHQICVLNCRLCVEYAESDLLQGILENKRVDDSRDVPDQKFFKTFINKINAFNDSVGFHQPPPSHLKYNYPKANHATINNIAHALATIPRFYTQVLHLMNKMNLPPPFAMPNPSIRTIQPSQHPVLESRPPENVSSKPIVSTSESEIESDSELKPKEVIPVKRTLPQKKVIKRPKFIKQPTVVPLTKPQKPSEEVFEKVEVQTQKKIELKVSASALKEKEETPKPLDVTITPEKTDIRCDSVADEPAQSPKTEVPNTIPDNISEVESKRQDAECQKVTEQTSPVIEPERKEEEATAEAVNSPEEDGYPSISLEELAANQITDLNLVSVFKNYNAGLPTNKLYIKNCAKTVVLQDLEYIYNRYREEGNANKASEFNIRLMQEGRMKGQAFVTLDSVEMAQKAVKETNGFILKDKPLVVVFGKTGTKNK